VGGYLIICRKQQGVLLGHGGFLNLLYPIPKVFLNQDEHMGGYLIARSTRR
jgi:hypothetical protein